MIAPHGEAGFCNGFCKVIPHGNGGAVVCAIELDVHAKESVGVAVGDSHFIEMRF